MGAGPSMDAEYTAMRIKDAIYVLRLVDDSKPCQFGCPGNITGAVRCNVDRSVYPSELEGIVPREDFFKMVEELDVMFRKTHVPLCPCCLTIVCYGCTLQLCQIQRVNRYNAIIQAANKQEMVDRGYYWENMARADGVNGYLDEFLMQLKIYKPTYDKWNAEHGIVAVAVGSSSGDVMMR